MNIPLVSIIIPTYNRAHLIGETLESVLAQTYQNWECIVVDDGSTDYTDELLEFYCKKDSRISYYHRPKDRPKGANACRNYGFEMSKGEYVNWFDSDDIMLIFFLERKIKAIMPHKDMIICSGFFVDQYLKNERVISLDKDSDLFKKYAVWKLKILTPSVLFRKSFLRDIKVLFLLTQSRSQERELFSRLFFKLSRNQYSLIEEPLFLYRQHNESKTFIDKNYNFPFYESHTYVYLENYKKSLLLNDSNFSEELYQWLLFFVFKAIKNNHSKNLRKILECFKNTIRKINYPKYLQIMILIKFCEFINYPSYRIEKYLKNIRVHTSKSLFN